MGGLFTAGGMLAERVGASSGAVGKIEEEFLNSCQQA
jgi:hypothetical protein